MSEAIEKQTSRETVWTGAFIEILIVSLAMRMCTQMQNTALPLYVLSRGHNTFWAGLMTGVYTLTALFFRPSAGNLVDKKGRYLVLMIGTIIFSITSGLYFFTLPLWLLLVVRGSSGMGFSWNGTAISTMATDVLPDHRMSEGIGYLGLAQTISMAIAPGLALALIDKTGYADFFLIVFGMSVAVLIICFTVRYEKNNSYIQNRRALLEKSSLEASSNAAGNQKWIYKVFEKDAWKPGILMLFVAIANCTIGTFLPAYTKGRGIENIGLFFTISAIMMALVRLIVGKVSARFGSATILIPGFILLSISLVGVVLSPSLPFLLTCSVFYGIAMGALQPEINAITVIAAERASRGAANATFLMMMDIGNGLGSALWGAVATLTGLSWIFVLAAFVSLAGLFSYVFLQNRKIVL